MSEMNCLARKPQSGADVRWDVAIVLALISQAVYENAPEQTRRIKRLGANNVTPLSKETSEGVVASDASSVVIAFRGTKGLRDIVTDVRVFGTSMDGGSVHGGFAQSIVRLYDDVLHAAKKHGAPGKAIWITGHSLGGAMAAGFAYRVITQLSMKRPAGIYTFGQPLVMSEVPAQEMLNVFQGNYVRFVNNYDWISRLMPPYRHSGARVHLKEDSYSIRSPRTSYSASVDSQDSPQWLYEDGDDEELPLMSDEEISSNEAAANATPTQTPTAASGELVTGFSLDPFTSHYMAGYIDHLRRHSK